MKTTGRLPTPTASERSRPSRSAAQLSSRCCSPSPDDDWGGCAWRRRVVSCCCGCGCGGLGALQRLRHPAPNGAGDPLALALHHFLHLAGLRFFCGRPAPQGVRVAGGENAAARKLLREKRRWPQEAVLVRPALKLVTPQPVQQHNVELGVPGGAAVEEKHSLRKGGVGGSRHLR
ncbi:uncharacterized protein Tco025E_04388 [Trypanosoma conorhini]|uniref:Uncharacterized protein n=1 Tax=Trypanosoma conorhini TaxID=83891 RepID=A0A3R7PEG9_9TRYP|nr:uncharacterized protein Tco025E_04388 [Trypanosoma conorhini]RNF18811.1 hypothetical protein Tco025E_04388 [Trypanosoma conorhini]